MGHTSPNRESVVPHHSLGDLIREERQRRGQTAAEFAADVRRAAGGGIRTNGKTVYRWENGDEPQPRALRALATVLGRSVEELTALARPALGHAAPVLYADARPMVVHVGGRGDDSVAIVVGRQELLEAIGGPGATAMSPLDDDDVNRRDFLLWLSVASTNAALLPVETPSAGRDEQSDRWIVHLDHRVRRNASLWRAFSAARSKQAVYPSVRDHIQLLSHDLRQARGVTQHRQLCALAGDAFQLAGEIFFDANHYPQATLCYTIAMEASKEAHAHDLWACAMARHAFIAIYERQFSSALPLLEAASRVASNGDGALSTRHWVHAVAAEAHAGTGDLASCQRALDQAEQVHALGQPAANGGWLRFDGSRLAEQRGACFTKLSRADLAEPALQEALALDLSARRRGLVLIDLASVAVQRREIEEASAYGEAAFETMQQCASGVIRRRLLELRERLAPFATRASVSELLDRTASL